MNKYFYVYYSYEEYGRGYIGKRECECLPEEDVRYFGSFKDKTFNPTQKIILETFDSVEEALEAECVLHDFYEVDKNPHFANRAKQTSTKFYFTEGGKISGIINGKKLYEQSRGIFGLTEKEKKESCSKGGKISGCKNKELGRGICGLSKEERSKYAKIGGSIGGKIVGKKLKEEGRGIFSLTEEERYKNSMLGAEKKSKNFSLVSPFGKIYSGKNILKFCKTNNLDTSCVYRVVNGKQKSHKGWTKP